MSSSTSNPRKRSLITVGGSAGGGGGTHPVGSAAGTTTAAAKRVRTTTTTRTAIGESLLSPPVPAATPSLDNTEDLRARFLATLALPQYATSGISNSDLKAQFGATEYVLLAPIINALTQESRLNMSHRTIGGGGSSNATPELCYQLVPDDLASKLSGLDVAARMVYQVIEKSQTHGIWTKDIRLQTNLQLQMLNKVLKALEGRRLVKPVKSVTAKAKKLYMLYDLVPSKEITGGVWYSDWEFDHSFIQELREFLMQCVRRLNGGKGTSVAEIRDKVLQSNVSRVPLGWDDVNQLMQTLVYDHLVDAVDSGDDTGTVLYEVSKRLTGLSEFQWWDAGSDDFHFRAIRFEDGITLAPHEPHYHTPS